MTKKLLGVRQFYSIKGIGIFVLSKSNGLLISLRISTEITLRIKH